ncbi:MAG: hypothetical protein EOP47_24990 [Sphingobacteriaceae bacterium]|nr:MAG: hypothetical protein EOP47_24990 [Sphingobacteriaceae bacterium]
MKVEYPAAFRFIMQDDVYQLKADKILPVNNDEPLQAAETIVPPVAVPSPIQETSKITFNYLGKNQKNILVLVYYPAHKFMDEVHLSALESTFKRKELGIEDIAIVNIADEPNTELEQLLTYFTPKKVLILGEKALAKGLPELPFNTPQAIGTIATLYTFGFDELMTSNENKKAFWEKVKNF